MLSKTLGCLGGVTAAVTGCSLIQCGMAKRLRVCCAALSGLRCAHWKGNFPCPIRLFFTNNGGALCHVPSFVVLLHGSRRFKGLIAFLCWLHRWQEGFGALALVCRVVCMCCGEEVVCRWTEFFGFTLAMELGFKGPGLEFLKDLTGLVKKFLAYVQRHLWLQGHSRR